MQYLLLQTRTAERTDPYKVAVPKGSGGFRARLHEGPAHRCPNIGPAGKLLTVALSKRSPRFSLHRNPLRIPTTSTGRHIYKANPGESGSCPTAGAGTAPGTSQIPGGTLARNAPSPGQRGAGRPPPLRLRAVPADGRAAAGEAPSSPHLPSPLPSLPARTAPAGAGGPLAPASRGTGSAARLGASQGAPPRGRVAAPRRLGITGSQGARAGSAVHRHHPSCPLPPGRRGGRCPSREPRLREARTGCSGDGDAGRDGGTRRPGWSPPPPRLGKRSRCQTTCSAAGEEGGVGGVKGGKVGARRGCRRGARKAGRNGVSPGRGRAGQAEGRLELRGGGEEAGKCPSPGPPHHQPHRNLKV